MKNLVPLPTDDLISWYDDIVAAKDMGDIKDELVAISPDIALRFDSYIASFNPVNLIELADSLYPANHAGLLSCYRSEGVILRSLKKIIREMQPLHLRGVCQYCGILKPKTMDHYIPISNFPEFSALAVNLVPCCKDCNGKKLGYWKEAGIRGIINFYIDTIPNQSFLFGRVVFISEIPHIEYFVDNPHGISEDFFAILTNHYRRLDLINLYAETAATDLGEMIRSFKIYVDNPTIASLQQKLRRDAAQLAVQYGINYWKSVLRTTIANSNEMLQYLINEINKND